MITVLLFFLLLVPVGAIWVLCGLGPYFWLQSTVSHRGLARLGLCAACGLALLGGMATQVFYLELAPIWTILLALAVSLGLGVAAVKTRRVAPREVLVELGRGAMAEKDLGLAGLILVAIVFLPGYQGGFGQPFRIGIDQVGYAVTTQYLRDGGTATALRREIVRQTGQPTEAMALNAHVTALNFNTSVAGEFLLKAHRFGYPTYLAGVGQLLGLRKIVDYQFCLLAVPWLCALLLLVWFFRDIVGLSDLTAKAAAIGVAMNLNQLNVLFEGQHAQIVVFPLLVMFFGALHRCREKMNGATGALVVLAGMGIFALYSDAFLALGVAGGLLWLADLLDRDWPALGRTTCFGLAVMAGMLVLNRYTFEWVGFIVRHVTNLSGGHGGWPQPHWASPAEIVGYFSMYRGELGNVLDRSSGNLWAEMVMVVAMVAVIDLGGYKAWRDNRMARFWLMPVIICMWVYVDLRWLKGFHNYSYMKFYTLLLVPLAGLHWATLQACVRHWGERWNIPGAWTNWAAAGAAGIVAAMGLFDSVHYLRTSQSLSAETRQAMQRIDRQLNLADYAVLTYPEGGIDAATLGAYCSFNWLNVGWSDKHLRIHRDKPIVIAVVGLGRTFLRRHIPEGEVLFQGEDLLVVRTGKRVGDLALPDQLLVADKLTTSLQLTHNQGPPMSLFLHRALGFKRWSSPSP